MDDTVSAVCRSLRPLTDTRVAAEELQRSLLQDLVLLSTNGAGIPGMICLNSGQDSIDNTLPMLFPYIDIPVALRWCASQLEIGYLCSDCRLFQKYPIKPAQAERLTRNNDSMVVSPADVVAKRPCLLYVDSFDAIFHDPAQQHSTSAEDSISAQLNEALKRFMRDLSEELDRASESGVTSVVTAASHVNPNAVVVVIATQHAEKLSAQWKSCIGVTIDLPWNVHRSAVFRGVLPEGGDLVATENRHQMTELEEDALWDYIEAHQLGFTLARELVTQYKLDAMAERNLGQWTAAVERGALSAQSQPCATLRRSRHSSSGRTDSSHLPPKARIAAVVQRVPQLRGVDCTFGADGKTTTISGGKRSSQASSIAAVRWGDIGGLERVRKEILDVLELPFKHPGLFHAGSPRRQGVLLYGPPGTGKTLVARAVATECGMNFISVKGPELLDMYVGESEKNVREVFQRAQAAAPCVLFFDEIDSLAPARAKGSGSGGGVMDRMVSQLLTEMDQLVALNSAAAAATSASTTVVPPATPAVSAGAEQEGEGGINDGAGVDSADGRPGTAKVVGKFVFVIAATNRPDLLDPALMRPGRFDRKIYLGVSKDNAARAQILAAQTRKFLIAADVDLLAVASALPANVTGADIGAVSTAAYGRALERKLSQLREDARRAIAVARHDAEHTNDGSTRAAPLKPEVEPSDAEVRAYVNRLPKLALEVRVEMEDFLHAARSIQPSVSDLAYYEAMGDEYNDA